MEHWFRLTTITRLLSVVTTLSLCEERSLPALSVVDAPAISSITYLASLVLCDLVLCVLLAILAFAVGLARLWNVHLVFMSANALLVLVCEKCVMEFAKVM